MIKIKAKKLSGLEEKRIGLLAYKEAIPVYFKTRFGIHTFGMKYSIDVVILDSKNRVVYLKSSLGKNRVFFWNPLYSGILELPVGTINKLGIEVGDNLAIEFDKSLREANHS